MSRTLGNSKKLLFIGSGNIAYAVAAGLVKNDIVPGECVTVYNRHNSMFEKFQSLGIKTSTDLVSASDGADYVFLAVKPKVVANVMEQLSEIDGLLDNAIIVSFAASVSIEHIEQKAQRECSVIRTTPSTPILVGEGVLAVTRNVRVSARDFQYFCRIMSGIAHVAVISEAEMNPIISVQGSSPAYVYLFVKAMLDAAEEQGINREEALPLILKTIKGSITMIEKSDEDIETLIKNVASPNGTTLAALNSFAKDDFVGTVSRAMNACTERANEISKEL